MTTYSLPVEPAGPLWTRDEDGTVRRWEREDDGLWHHQLREGTWRELLEMEPTDHHPDLPEGVIDWLATQTDRLRNPLDSESDGLVRFVVAAVQREVERIERGAPNRDDEIADVIDLVEQIAELEQTLRQLVDAGREVIDVGHGASMAEGELPHFELNKAVERASDLLDKAGS